nr:bifunctional protein fold [Quercus suber]POF12683.1 bifunctional protein fold [Quercus suber]
MVFQDASKERACLHHSVDGQALSVDDASITSEDVSSVTLGVHDEKFDHLFVTSQIVQGQLLKGGPTVSEISSWCQKHKRGRAGTKATLAVMYFDTGDDAEEYLYVKAVVAARAGVGYSVHKLAPDAPIDDVLEKINELNEDDEVHGVLIQRPVPEHLWERQVMDSVRPQKHVEEFTHRKASNIALDGLIRLLTTYHRNWMLNLNIIMLGGTNIITPQFKAELKRRHRHFDEKVQLLSEPARLDPGHDTIVVTELNKGGIVTPDMLGPAIKLVVDVGFDPDTKTGDLDPDVLDVNGLVVVPTPGGVLPVLLWIMMERTIKARDQSERSRALCGLSGCAVC